MYEASMKNLASSCSTIYGDDPAVVAVSALFAVATIVCQGFEFWSGFVMLVIISLKKEQITLLIVLLL